MIASQASHDDPHSGEEKSGSVSPGGATGPLQRQLA
jgi:hypothetical protein